MCLKPAPPQKTYLIAIDKDWPSLSLGVRNANMTAFCETVLQAVARNQQLRLSTVQVSTQNIFQKLNSKQYAGVISPLLPQLSHTLQYLYSVPLYHLGPVLVVNKTSRFTSIAEMDGKAIGIVKDIAHLIDVTSYPKLRFIYYDTPSQAFADLAHNKIDGVVMESLYAHANIQGLYANAFRILSPQLQEAGIRLILLHESKADEQFMEAFNQGLQDLREDGAYKDLIGRWDLVNTE